MIANEEKINHKSDSVSQCEIGDCGDKVSGVQNRKIQKREKEKTKLIKRLSKHLLDSYKSF